MYNSNVNVNLYKTFLVVANSKSLSDAAEKMLMDRTAISKNIKQLESTLGVKLFFRDKIKGMWLTDEGKELYDYVDKSLSLLEAGEKVVIEKDDLSTSRIVIGSLSHLSAFYVMDCIAKIKKDYSKLQVELITGSTVNSLLDLLESHKIDFAIDSTIIKDKKDDICIRELKIIENIFISKKPIKIKDIKELSNYEYIFGAEYSNTTREIEDILKKNGIDIKKTIAIDTTELRVEAVEKGLGLSYVMKDAVIDKLRKKEIYEVKVPFKLPKSKIHLIYLKGHLSKADNKFIKEYLK